MNETTTAAESIAAVDAALSVLPGFEVVQIPVEVEPAKPDLENKFFKYIWNGWLGLASPVLSNTGTDRGLPISCFGIDTPDSIRGILDIEYKYTKKYLL